MALYPYGLIPWIELRFLKIDDDGNLVPNDSGTVSSFAAGTSTPLATYATATGTANAVTLTLDADGRLPSPMFLAPTGYKFTVKNSSGTTLYTIDGVEDAGSVFANTFGQLQTAGSKNVTSGYTVISTDRLITVNSTGGPNPCIINLPAASSLAQLLVIKNVGTIPLAVTPNGADTIDGLAAAYTIAAALSPSFPSKIFSSDGTSAIWVWNV